MAIFYPSWINHKERSERSNLRANINTISYLMEQCLVLKSMNTKNLTLENLNPKQFYFDDFCKKDISKSKLETIKNKYKNSIRLEDILTNYNNYLKSKNKKEYSGYFLYKTMIDINSNSVDKYELFYVDANGDILINPETGDIISSEVDF